MKNRYLILDITGNIVFVEYSPEEKARNAEHVLGEIVTYNITSSEKNLKQFGTYVGSKKPPFHLVFLNTKTNLSLQTTHEVMTKLVATVLKESSQKLEEFKKTVNMQNSAKSIWMLPYGMYHSLLGATLRCGFFFF